MLYIYEITTKILVVQDSLDKLPPDISKVEAVETLEDIPFHEYEYYDLPPSISEEQVRNRIREPFYPIKEKNPLTPSENEYGVLTEI